MSASLFDSHLFLSCDFLLELGNLRIKQLQFRVSVLEFLGGFSEESLGRGTPILNWLGLPHPGPGSFKFPLKLFNSRSMSALSRAQ